MSGSTPATLVLTRASLAFTQHRYDYDPDADRIGLQAAEALAVSPGQLLKTLMAKVDGKPVCVIVPSDRTVAMKKLASALRGKSAEMMAPADAERMSGYKVGGISPLGQRRRVPVVLEEAAMLHEQVYVNGGQRGLQLLLAPSDLRDALDAQLASVT